MSNTLRERTRPREHASPDAESAAAVDFLSKIPGRHCLVAIDPAETDAIEARTFSPAEMDAARVWIAERSGRRNLYWSVNEPAPRARTASKLTKAEIGRIRFLHVDLDPAADRDLDTERARLRAVVDTAPEAQSATAVDTGGGYALFWPVQGDMPHDEAERANKALAVRLGGDCSAWNIDRIMRLPGTINLPTAKKRARGRKEAAPATLLRMAPAGSGVTAETFAHQAAPHAAASETAAGEAQVAETIALSGWDTATWENLTPERRALLDDALSRSPRLNAGFHGTRKSGDTSRSGYVMAIAAACKAEGLSVEDYALLLACSPALKDWEPDNRQATRAWIRSAEPADASQWFAATPGGPGPPVGSVQPRPGIRLHALEFPIPAAEIPRRAWLVSGVLPEGEAVLLVGPPKTAKSAFVMHLAMAVAAGNSKALFGAECKAPWAITQARRVLIVNNEDPTQEMRRRAAAIERRTSVHPSAGMLTIISGADPDQRPVTVMNGAREGYGKPPTGHAELARIVQDLKPDLIIFDSLVSLGEGLEENSNTAMDRLIRELRALGSGATVLIVHHTAKGRGKDISAGDMDAARGASAIFGAVRGSMTIIPIADTAISKLRFPPGHYIRLDDGGGNYGPRTAGAAVWRIISGPVGNGTGETPLPSAAAHLFASDEEFELRRGDTAPILEFMGMHDFASLGRTSAAKVTPGAGAGKAGFSRLLIELLGDAEEVTLDAPMRARIGKELFRAGLITATGDRTVQTFLAKNLASPIDAERNGQPVRISVVKEREIRSAPRILRCAPALADASQKAGFAASQK
jgi:KaiC/GvpD/RAD55 family RecA-like ATPase